MWVYVCNVSLYINFRHACSVKSMLNDQNEANWVCESRDRSDALAKINSKLMGSVRIKHIVQFSMMKTDFV